MAKILTHPTYRAELVKQMKVARRRVRSAANEGVRRKWQERLEEIQEELDSLQTPKNMHK